MSAAVTAPLGGTAALEAAGLVRRFGGSVVVGGVSLRLQPGHKVLLLGANAAGKSTLLRLLAGLLTPDGGAIRVAGYDIARQHRQATARIGYVGHAALLYRDLSAEENLRLFARLYGLRAPVAGRRAGGLLEEVGLLARRHERVRTLSQGQRQRLALARALLHDPPVLLLDEPFAALDAPGREWLVARLAADRGRTVLLATHQLDLAPAAVDRVLRLEGGRLWEEAACGGDDPSGPDRQSARVGDGATSLASVVLAGTEPDFGAGRSEARGAPRSMTAPEDSAGRSEEAPAGDDAPARDRRPPLLRMALLLAGKDLRIEWRNRLRLQSLLLCGVALALVGGLALRGQADPAAALPALVWPLAVFLQLLFLGQLYQAETEDGGFDALRLAPVPRGAIALAKTAAGALLAGGAGLVALALLARVIGSGLPLRPGLLLLLALETVGMTAAGSLVFAATAAGEEPALDLHALALALTAPLIGIGQDASRRLLAGAPAESLVAAFLVQGAYAAGLVVVTAIAYGDFAERPPAPPPG